MTPTRRSWLSLFALAPTAAMAGRALAAEVAPDTAAAGRMIVLVRHAEKAADDPRDPSLSAIGQARVVALTELLAPLPLATVLVTSLRRTRLTAEAAALAHGLTPIVVPFADTLQEHASAMASQALAPAAGAVSLIVGHSNTLPLIIEALGGPAIEIGDERYVDLFLLLPQAGSQPPWFLRASYGCTSG
jgi:phosphohistidine phosphatase SixA